MHLDPFRLYLICVCHSFNYYLFLKLFHLQFFLNLASLESFVFVLDEVVVDFEELRPQLLVAQYSWLEGSLEGFANLE